jgi:hypothetical protein
LKKPSTQYGTLARYINYLLGIFDQYKQACYIFSFWGKIQSFFKGKMFVPREVQAWVPQGSILYPTLKKIVPVFN